ncbi:glycosyl hydrolase [Talaromyces proteolyticus]|uniref:Glycosyl hydrolase n=1 Tax=Talaromyces proteolyticus TaxID=1131652 RepID=A0AAD4KRX4_9EURO|nr:glycosyl hydrolase [Talaromyces proteolyticus]KAH8695601.1 glycosyl hydrolase [Talaromyces proteolyticus]
MGADGQKHYFGVATSPNVTGPYEPTDSPIACPLGQGGAIDTVGFIDDDETQTIWICVQILDRDPNGGDGFLIEAPSIIKSEGIYYMTFSSAMFNTPQYISTYAYATSITGPWSKQHSPYAPILQTGNVRSAGQLTGLSGSSFAKDKSKIGFNASRNGLNADEGRAVYMGNITLGDNIITIV